jgi:hypothetical protein
MSQFNYSSSPYLGPGPYVASFETQTTLPGQFIRYFQRDQSKRDGFGLIAHKGTGVLRQPEGADPVELWECRVVPIRRVEHAAETPGSASPEPVALSERWEAVADTLKRPRATERSGSPWPPPADESQRHIGPTAWTIRYLADVDEEALMNSYRPDFSGFAKVTTVEPRTGAEGTETTKEPK